MENAPGFGPLLDFKDQNLNDVDQKSSTTTQTPGQAMPAILIITPTQP